MNCENIKGLLMLWQNYYQKRRHYARIAMGKASHIDISTSETMVDLPQTKQWKISNFEYTLLKMCCYGLYLLEIAMGIEIMRYTYFTNLAIPGLLFFLFFVTI